MVAAAMKSGARLIAGGPKPPDGLADGVTFVRPTVLQTSSTWSMQIAQEEVFGPVLSDLARTTDDGRRRADRERQPIRVVRGGVVD